MRSRQLEPARTIARIESYVGQPGYCDMDNDSSHALTQLIDKARAGNVAAESELCERVFGELREMAGRLMPCDEASMQPTMLVNDLFVKLFRNQGLKKTENRRYFFTVAADQMRKMLIDHYRHKKTLKVGGGRMRLPLDIVLDTALDEFESRNQTDMGALSEALENLRHQSERQYQVVMQRFFVGLSIAQTAEILKTSESTVEREWRLARAKLHADLRNPE